MWSNIASLDPNVCSNVKSLDSCDCSNVASLDPSLWSNAATLGDIEVCLSLRSQDISQI